LTPDALKKFPAAAIKGSRFFLRIVYKINYIMKQDKNDDNGFNQLSIDEFKRIIEQGSLLIDARNSFEFTNGFIPGSIFIGIDGKLAEWAKNLVPAQEQIVFVANEGKEEEVFISLKNAGFLNIAGYLEGGFTSWTNAGEDIDLVIDIEADELAMDLPFEENLLVLDVRQPEEYAEGHVKDALNIPLKDMTDLALIAGFDEDQTIYIHCAAGYRSVIAASILKKEGYHNLRNIIGGFEKIKEQKTITIEKDSSLLN